ncbi:hypothetical protein MKX03_016012 [Papaver bracteatum]|nr:hypothetical protein MKX03_016012 [Papaver bracteatum]
MVERQQTNQQLRSPQQGEDLIACVESLEAAKLQLYFIGVQHVELPTKEATLRKDIAKMEEEMRTKTHMIKKHEKLILWWRKKLKYQLDKHITELERV